MSFSSFSISVAILKYLDHKHQVPVAICWHICPGFHTTLEQNEGSVLSLWHRGTNYPVHSKAPHQTCSYLKKKYQFTTYTNSELKGSFFTASQSSFAAPQKIEGKGHAASLLTSMCSPVRFKKAFCNLMLKKKLFSLIRKKNQDLFVVSDLNDICSFWSSKKGSTDLNEEVNY